jgi:hypothetical protein
MSVMVELVQLTVGQHLKVMPQRSMMVHYSSEG